MTKTLLLLVWTSELRILLSSLYEPRNAGV